MKAQTYILLSSIKLRFEWRQTENSNNDNHALTYVLKCKQPQQFYKKIHISSVVKNYEILIIFYVNKYNTITTKPIQMILVCKLWAQSRHVIYTQLIDQIQHKVTKRATYISLHLMYCACSWTWDTWKDALRRTTGHQWVLMVSYVKTRYIAGIWNIQKIKVAWLKYIHSDKPRDIATCIKQQDVTHIFVKYIVNI